MKYPSIIIFGILFSVAQHSTAQCDSLTDYCMRYLSSDFISDGQTYKALLTGDEVAEFNTTLFKGTTYRIAACSGSSDNTLIFKIVDQDKNILFSNVDFSTSPYWEFMVENTMPVTIETMLDNNKSDSGCATIVIGFQK
ncbi:MAG: hypothetical protein IPP69_16400 [Flavobacteriales bacterium]|nr:hypothetical protein [Flavobacteriales bacterium]